MATTAYTYIHYNDLNGLRIMSMNDCMWAQRELELLRPCVEKVDCLTTELGELFKESHRLEDEIRKQLGSIGFNVS